MIGVFGIVHHSKRVEAVVEALPGVLDANPGAVVLVVGRAHEPRYLTKLEDLARDLGVEGSVRFLGEVDSGTFDAALVACDVVVNLRESTVTHLSATLMRAMAAGKPVLTSEAAGWDFLPDDACVRIASGGALEAELCRLVATSPSGCAWARPLAGTSSRRPLSTSWPGATWRSWTT